jgi:hypothetical protein
MVLTVLGFKHIEEDEENYNSPLQLEPPNGNSSNVVTEYFEVYQRWPQVAARRFVKSMFKGLDNSFSAIRNAVVYVIVFDEHKNTVTIYKTRLRMLPGGNLGVASPKKHAAYFGVRNLNEFKSLGVLRGHATLLKEYKRSHM